MGPIPFRLLAAALCVAALAVAGCGGDDSSSTTGAAGGDQAVSEGGAAGKDVVHLSCPASNPNCAAFNKATVEGIEQSGAKVTSFESDFDPAVQVEQLNQAIAQKPDLIVILPIDTKSITPSVKRAQQADVPMIVIASRAEPSVEDDIVSQIIPDNAQLGRFAAMNIIEGLKERGLDEANVIAITGTKGAENTEARMKAFHEEMAKEPGYEVVAEEDGNWDAVLTGQIAQKLFAKFASQGGIQGAYGMADYQAIPIVQAAKQAGIPVGVDNDGLIVTGSNCTTTGIKAVRRGDMFGSATQDPLTQGIETADWIVKWLDGEEIPKEIILPQERITRDTVEEFAEQCFSS